VDLVGKQPVMYFMQMIIFMTVKVTLFDVLDFKVVRPLEEKFPPFKFKLHDEHIYPSDMYHTNFSFLM